MMKMAESQRNWMLIQRSKRDECLSYLRSIIHRKDLDKIRALVKRGDWNGFHDNIGMVIRSVLRARLPDDKLPGESKSWDDYYLGALMEL